MQTPHAFEWRISFLSLKSSPSAPQTAPQLTSNTIIKHVDDNI